MLLSFTLHCAFGWWALHADRFQPDSITTRAAPEQRVVLRLLPLADRAVMQPPTPPPRTATKIQGAEHLAKLGNKRGSPLGKIGQGIGPGIEQQSDQHIYQQSDQQSDQPSQAKSPASAAPLISAAPFAVDPTAIAARAKQPLQLGLGRAALQADQARRSQPLSRSIDAQQVESARSNDARAFSSLAAVPSGIVAETALAGGARLIRFSGGGCMVVPNQAARLYDDTRKPVMTNC